MAKFPLQIIDRAVGAGFSHEEINKAQRDLALEVFEEQITEREDKMMPDGEDAGLLDNIHEVDMTDRPAAPMPVLLKVAPRSIMGELDPNTLQRFEALCLLKGWGFGEKLTQILEGLLTNEGFKREDKVDQSG